MSVHDAAVAKVVRRILPVLFLGAVLAQLDRVNISMASLSMMGDVGISPAIYGFGAGVFFVIYALFEVPSNAGLVRFGARRWITRIMLSWGIISASTAFVAGPTSFIANRALLAAAEAGFLPGVLAFLASWLPPDDRSRIFSIFLIAVPVANIIGGPLAAALFNLDGAYGLHGWQWLFILEGIAPILVALPIWLLVRDFPHQARWLSNEEAEALTQTVYDRQMHHPRTQGSFRRAISNPRVLLYTSVLGLLGGINHAVTFWLPQVISSFGFGVTQVGFIAAAPYVLGVVAMIGWSVHSDRTGERRWHLAGPAMLAGVALAGSIWVPVGGPRLIMVSIAITCVLAIQGIFWSAVSAEFEGEERTITMAVVSAGGILFAFLAPTLIGLSKQFTGGFDFAFVILGGLGVAGGALATLLAAGLSRVERAARL